ADTFSIRYVCGFGSELPDGVIPLDELFTMDQLDPMPSLKGAPDNLALITWDTDLGRAVQGHVPVARSHAQVIAGGLSIAREADLESGEKILATTSLGSFSGIASTLVSSLLCDGTLHFHQGFDPEIVAQQLAEDCTCAILPGPLVSPLNDAGL